jgi:hypothetical protein
MMGIPNSTHQMGSAILATPCASPRALLAIDKANSSKGADLAREAVGLHFACKGNVSGPQIGELPED